MATYLLGFDALRAYLLGTHARAPSADDKKFRAWAQGLTPQDYVGASHISVAQLRASVERIVAPTKRDSTGREIESRLASLKDSLIAIDEPILKKWAVLRANQPDRMTDVASVISAEQNIEIATALAFGHVFVTRITPALTKLQEDYPELQILDPWA